MIVAARTAAKSHRVLTQAKPRYHAFMRATLVLIALLGCGNTSPKSKPNSTDVAQTKSTEGTDLKPETLRPRVKAHRGASATAPENTLAAVELAFAQGADATEIDVRVSKDDVVVVFHDEDTMRIGGRGALVAEQTLEELRELDVGAWKHPKYAGEKIATLAEVLSALPAGRTLFVEIKDGVQSVPSVIREIGKTPTEGNVAIESFDADVLRAVKSAMPDLPVHQTLGATKNPQGAILPFAPSLASSANAAGFSGLSVDARGVNRAFADAVRAEGLELAVWTVNDPALLARLRDFPVTWIESDVPDMVVRTLAREPR